ncbi:MAG: pyridoxal phosphate-dependent aminotransferase, partial [Bryobacteraceae bacterium]|nr:pyridoxal phosphate-dependent aminotransferase [Bryobacteraceae bacterium]
MPEATAVNPLEWHLSEYGGRSAQPSPASRMMASFARDFRDCFDINLGVGYVNERTIPAGLFREALAAVCADPVRYRQAFNYGGPEGSPNLIRSLRRFLARRNAGLDEQALSRLRLIIGPCGAMSVLEGFAEVCRPGIVVTSDPGYYIYLDALERRGFRLLAVPEDEEGIRTDLMEQALAGLGDAARSVSFFYVMTVSNPTGTILSDARRREVLRVATEFSLRQKRRVPVLFDLAYEWLVHDPAVAQPESVLREDGLGIAFEAGTLSKILAPALRIGYLLGPDGELMNAMVQRTSDAGFSAPLFVQEMASWLLDHHMEAQIRAVNEGYREKALAVREAIRAELGPWLESCTGGSAGFYFYLTFRGVETCPGSPFFPALT